MPTNSFTRSAPRPLSVYLGAAMSLLAPDAGEEERARHQQSMLRMVEGIRKYQENPWKRGDTSLETVW